MAACGRPVGAGFCRIEGVGCLLPMSVRPSRFVAGLLRRLEGREFPLHSRFERSANFTVGSATLITLTSPALGLSPFGLAAGGDLFPVIPLVVRAGGLRFNRGAFWAGGTPVLELAPVPPYSSELHINAARPQLSAAAFRRLLGRVTTGAGLAELLNTDRQAGGSSEWVRMASPSMAAFAGGKPGDRLPDAARQLIGLGLGLTPSGDDFLLGFVAARMAQGYRKEVQHLRRALTAHMMRATNLISASYLRHGFRGRFSSHLKQVLELLHKPGVTEAAVLPALADLVRVGSTSGQDTLMGVLAALDRNETGPVPPQ